MPLAPPEASGSTTMTETGETAVVKPAVASMKTGEIEGGGDGGRGGGEEWTTKDDGNDGASGVNGDYGFDATKQEGIVEEESPPKGVLKPPARQRRDPRDALLRKVKAKHEAETDRKLAAQNAVDVNTEKGQLFADAKDGSDSAQFR